MQDKRVEAVLFDFGGVFTGSPALAVEEVGREIGVEGERLIEILFGPLDFDSDHPWHRLERAELSLAQAREDVMRFAAEQGATVDPFQVFARIAVKRTTHASLADRVRTLRSDGYRTGLITNNVAEFSQGWRSLLPVDELFEVVVDSSEVGMRKPSPEIYRLALEQLGGIAPERSVFLDDFLGNVRGAKKIGMHGIHVGPDPLETIRNLDAFLSGARNP